MRFSCLVAAEIFFSSLICIGIAGCLGFDDIKIELTNFFLKNNNKMMGYDDFKCRKDSHSGLLLNANININEEINPEYKLLLCLEEFMYAFRSFFEDKINVKQGKQNLFDSFCRYVAGKIKSDNKDFDDNEHDVKREKVYDVLFLNLCKLFFIDKEKDICGDVRYFGVIFKLLHNDQEDILEYLKTFISQVYQRLKDFVDEEQLNTKNFNANDTPELLKIDEQNSIIDSLFVKDDSKGAPSQAKEEPKETFFLKKFSPAKVFFKEIKKQCTVLIYDDFVVFKNIKSNNEIVWERERKNRATPYSFYRKLSKEEILEIDIFAKDPKKKVIDILEKEIKEQMLYDFNVLCSQITEFISWFEEGEVAFEYILGNFVCPVITTYSWKNTDNFVKSELGIDDVEKKIKSYFRLQKQKCGYVVYPSDACLEIFKEDYKLTEGLWLFLSLVGEGFYKGISRIFNENRSAFFQKPWFKGLKNIGNSCYMNALSQNLFDYKKEMGGMVSDKFLKIMSNFQDSGEIIQDDISSLEDITGHKGYEEDANDLFLKLFTLGEIKEKNLAVLENKNSDINCEDNVNKKLAADDSFVFKFNSKFLCTESKFGEEKLDFMKEFNSDGGGKKSLQYVLKCIYDYLKKNYDGLSLILTSISKCPIFLLNEFCENNEYSIHISPASVIDIGSSPMCNGCDLSQFINKLKWEKTDNDVDLRYVAYVYYNFSDFLVINLKRYNKREPLRNNISIPDNICFGGDRYDITGIVCHSGGLNSGHYVAYKKKFGLWFKFDDRQVTVVGPPLPDEAVNCAYMLFFKKHKKIKDNKKTELKKEGLKNISKERGGNIEKLRKQEEERKKREETGRRIKQEEERKKKEENEKKNREIFLSELLNYYSLFKEKYFGNKNRKWKSFVEYLQNIVKDKKETQYILNLKEEYDLQFCAFLLLEVQNYYDLMSKSIKGKDMNSNKLNKIHGEKGKLEELEKLEKDIIMLICKDPTLRNFYNKGNNRLFWNKFVKVFFISFCDFDNTCKKPLFGKDTLQSLKKGDVEFFFEKDKNINIPDDRELPFFLFTHTTINDQQDGVRENDPKEEGDTIPGDGKYYCFWSDKLIIAQDKKKQVNNIIQLNNEIIDKNEINEGNKKNTANSNNIKDDQEFKNLALFKKTFEVAGYGFFERADDQLNDYSIQNIVGEVREEREKKLNHLLSFIEKIENFIKEIDGAINECQQKIKNMDRDFFIKKKNEIKTKYNQHEEDLKKLKQIKRKYEEEIAIEGENIAKIEDGIKAVQKQIEDIRKKIQYVPAQPNTQVKGTKSKYGEKSRTQVSGRKNNVSTQRVGDKRLERLENKLQDLYVTEKTENGSLYKLRDGVGYIEEYIKYLAEEKEKLWAVLKDDKINFEQYKKRFASYFPYYKGKNKGKWEKKKNGKEVLTVLDKLKKDITAVLESNVGYTIQSFNINIKDIINPFNSYSFYLFVSTIENEIMEIISAYKICDLYEYLFFEEKTWRRVLCGNEQRFKGLRNMRNTCYINSILQNLVEFKDDLEVIKKCPKDNIVADKKVETIHDEVFDVLGEIGKDPRIGLHNVLDISITNGFGETGEPSEVYSSLLNYYINKQYQIEVVNGKGEVFVYTPLKVNAIPSFNAKLFLPLEWEKDKEKKDKDIIDYLYNNKEFKKSIKEYIPVSQGPYVFKNTIKRKYCEECGKNEITIAIDCSPYCMINIREFIGKANNISQVVTKKFDVGIEEDQMENIECDLCKTKSAICKSSSCYRAMNNCLCFYFVVSGYYATNSIDIEDEVTVGGEVYESVCACYYIPGHHIAFKKINDIWFVFDDNVVSPTIYKSLPKMCGKFKPILVFYKKKIRK